MRNLFLILLGAFFLVTPAYAADSIPQVVAISGDEIDKMIDDGANLVIIDTRYDKAYWDGHIKNAVNLPAESVDSSTLDQVTKDMKTKLIFYCDDMDCATAKIAANKALGAGYRYVYLYSGGFVDWVKHGYAVSK